MLAKPAAATLVLDDVGSHDSLGQGRRVSAAGTLAVTWPAAQPTARPELTEGSSALRIAASSGRALGPARQPAGPAVPRRDAQLGGPTTGTSPATDAAVREV